MNISRSALSLVIYKKGHVNERDVDSLLKRYRQENELRVDKDKYINAVRVATEHYWKKQTCLFVCTANPCGKNLILDANQLQTLEADLGCPVEITGCHWQCDQGPALTLKVDATALSFLNCSTYETWRSARSSIKAFLNRTPAQEETEL